MIKVEIRHLLFQWRIQDFPEGDANWGGDNLLFGIILQKNRNEEPNIS